MKEKIKNIFSKPHNLLFAASALLFLQFVASVASYYMQVVLFYEFDYAIDFVYVVYCLALFVVLAVFVIKKQNDEKSSQVRVWFSGIMLYMFAELAMFIKMLAISYNDSLESVSNLWDNQHLYRLYMCMGAIALIYTTRYILEKTEKKKTALAFAGANLLVFFIFIMAVPDMGEFLLGGDENILQVTGVVFVKEIAVVILAANTFICGLREAVREQIN